MSPPNLRIRRATTDDFQSLRSLWKSMRLPAGELEKRLTEFQVIETADGQIVGAIGVQIIRQHALLHSEGYTDFAVADAARQLFWERIQTIAAHHGVFRLWTQENSPFWARWGFQPANAEILERLPEEWKRSEGKWLTIQLKNEEAIAALDKELERIQGIGKTTHRRNTGSSPHDDEHHHRHRVYRGDRLSSASPFIFSCAADFYRCADGRLNSSAW